MTKIAKQLTDLIGNTPLLELNRYARHKQLNATLWAKLESFNPAGSVKDRVALSLVEEAERNGQLQPGATLIEPTSGNTGIGLAMVAAAKGYRVILTMPETMSLERRKLLQAFGAQIELTPGAAGMQGAIDKAQALQTEIPGSVVLGQFDNPANPAAHERTTGPEIWQDTDGRVDCFIAGVGTGGTISGVGRYLKAQNPAIRIIGVEPNESPVLSGGAPGAHKIQGIGAGFIPKNYDPSVVDEVIRVPSNEAIRTSRLLTSCEGVLAGISSGAALYGATLFARRPENRDKRIVILLPDTGERYLSTELYAFEEYPL